MSKILYSRIKKAEKLNDNLENSVAKFQKSLEKFRNMPGYSEVTLGEIPVIDIPEYQKRIMREYESNPVLNDAIQKKISIEDSLSELAQVNRPILRLLPRTRNKAHNQRLDQIGELIGYSHHLRRNGLFILDNFIGGVAMVAACA